MDDESRLEFVTTRVTAYKGLVVAYRAPMLSTGQVGIEEKSPIHVADVIRMMSESNPAKGGSGRKDSTSGDQARGGQNGSSIKIPVRGRAEGNILPRGVTFADQQPPVAGQRGISPGREAAKSSVSAKDQLNPKWDRTGEENRLKAVHGRFVQRYDVEHSNNTDLNVISHSPEHSDAVGTEIYVSHKWIPRGGEPITAETKRSSHRERTARVLSNVKSMRNGFVAEEVDNERQSFGASDVLPINRKRPLIDGGNSAPVSDTNYFSAKSAAASVCAAVMISSIGESPLSKNKEPATVLKAMKRHHSRSLLTMRG